MKLRHIIGVLTAFSGGIFTGLLLAPRSGPENRKWISDQSRETKSWLENKSQQLVREGEKRIDRVSKGIRRTLDDTLPDLYEATEGLDFTDYSEDK